MAQPAGSRERQNPAEGSGHKSPADSSFLPAGAETEQVTNGGQSQDSRHLLMEEIGECQGHLDESC